VLEWNAGGAPQRTTQYDIQINTTQDFTFPIATYQTNGSTKLEVSGLNSMTTYFWRARARGPAMGTNLWSDPFQFTTGMITALDDPIPDVRLDRIYPQPASAQAWIQYVLPRPMEVNILVTDTSGKLIYRSGTGLRQAGQYQESIVTADWPEGMYLITLQAGQNLAAQTLVVQH